MQPLTPRQIARMRAAYGGHPMIGGSPYVLTGAWTATGRAIQRNAHVWTASWFSIRMG